jgi:hypothetical protein
MTILIGPSAMRNLCSEISRVAMGGMFERVNLR